MKEGTEMKKMKKMMALVIAVVMMMAMSMTTMAEGSGTITISSATKGQTYNIYKVFELESVDSTNTIYSYKIVNNWKDFFTTNYINTTNGFGDTFYNDYFENRIDADGYLVNFNASSMTAAEKSLLAKQMLKYVTDKGITASQSKEAEDTTVIFENMDNGYYLVDSTLGALCSLDTLNGSVKIADKNAKPTIMKQVKEDSTGVFQDSATVDLIDTIEYKLTVNMGSEYKDANNNGHGTGNDDDFIITDNFAGDIYPESIVVADENSVIKRSDAEPYWTRGVHYEVSTDGKAITLKTVALSKLAPESKIYITYTAKLNETANHNEVYSNTATLEYNDYTVSDSANVVSYDIEVFKHTSTNSSLAGAQFKLYKGTKTKEYATVTGTKVTKWTTETPENKGTIGSVLESNSNPEVNIKITGLDAGTYYLEEINAPAGYNKLSSPIEVVIAEDEDIKGVEDKVVKILNQSGSLLPETGGIGTTIFYTAGALLVIAGVVVLVTRKRMENQ